MQIKELAKRIDRSVGHISHVKNESNNVKMTLELAEKLEKATGISREFWAWPKRWGVDPWTELKKV